MFITSFGEQNITYRSCSNLRIHLLAYRTGMRLDEILGLRVQDVEGLSCLSVWIRPYGSIKTGNLHELKTDSSERNVPVYVLLKADEY